MNGYYVLVPEVWYQKVYIEAETEDDAITLVRDGNGHYLDNELEYSHTLEEGFTASLSPKQPSERG